MLLVSIRWLNLQENIVQGMNADVFSCCGDGLSCSEVCGVCFVRATPRIYLRWLIGRMCTTGVFGLQRWFCTRVSLDRKRDPILTKSCGVLLQEMQSWLGQAPRE